MYINARLRPLHIFHLFGLKIIAQCMIFLVKESKKTLIRCASNPNLSRDITILRIFSFVSMKQFQCILLSIVITRTMRWIEILKTCLWCVHVMRKNYKGAKKILIYNDCSEFLKESFVI